MIIRGVCHHGRMVIEGCNDCVHTAMGMKRDPALVDPDEFGRAMLGRSRPCPHGRLRALRDCEFCDFTERTERRPESVIYRGDGYQLRIHHVFVVERGLQAVVHGIDA